MTNLGYRKLQLSDIERDIRSIAQALQRPLSPSKMEKLKRDLDIAKAKRVEARRLVEEFGKSSI